MLIACLPPSVHALLAALMRSSTSPPVWIETALPHRSAWLWMPTVLAVLTMTTWPVAMYGTASATASRVVLTYRADQTMSQRPACRSGMRVEKPVFFTASFRPSLAATALAASTSKPTAWPGSVTSADGKYSIGGYSMSTQSVSVPAVIRLVGGVIGFSVGATDGGLVGGGLVATCVGLVVAPPLPLHAATNRAMATLAATRWVRITVSSSSGSRRRPIPRVASGSTFRIVALLPRGPEFRTRLPRRRVGFGLSAPRRAGPRGRPASR